MPFSADASNEYEGELSSVLSYYHYILFSLQNDNYKVCLPGIDLALSSFLRSKINTVPFGKFWQHMLPLSFQTKYGNWRSIYRKLSNAKHTKHSLWKGEGWPGRMWKATKWSLLAVLTGKSHKTTKGWNQAARLT